MADVNLPHPAPVAAEQAFGDNRLLATFPMELRESLRDQVEVHRLEAGDLVLRRGVDVQHSLFPFGPTMISMVVDLGDGRSSEVAAIGKEGAVGGIVSCGHSPGFTRAVAILPGRKLRVPMRIIEEA